jgi:cytochrome P450
MSTAFDPRRLATPEVIENPYPAYDALRADSPVSGYADWPPGTVPGFDPPIQAWALLSYDQVAAAAKDHQTFSSANFQQGTDAPTLMLVNHDDPEHAKLRKLVVQAFTPRRVSELRPAVQAVVKQLIESLPEGEVDVVARLCAPLPARLMVRLLGQDESMTDAFARWANAFMLSADMSVEERTRSNIEMVGWFQQMVDQRLARLAAGAAPQDDLVDALLTAESEGAKLTRDEVWRFCFTLVVAGSETTMYYAANCLHALVRNPEVFERLRAERSLIPRFQQETLRLAGPPQRLFRKVTRDVEIGGKQIRAGEWVALFFAAANHDPKVFPEPQRLRLDRENGGAQLSFGHGIHFCLGAPLANLETACLVEGLLDRFGTMRPGATPPEPQRATLLQHSVTRLPVVFGRA